MIVVDYPKPTFRTKKDNGREFIFDTIRREWIMITDEEWVRQNFIQYLIQVQHYPSTLIGVEKEIRVGELKKRFDILVYDKLHQPWMLIECKSSAISLDEKVLQQALRYSITIPATFIVITNGNYTYAWEKTGTQLKEIPQMPAW